MMRLRQVAWAAGDLAGAEASVETTLGLSRCFRDPGVGVFGLHNALYPIGDQFLEIVSPLPGEDNTAAGRLLAKRGGDAGYMVILQTDDLDGVRQRAADLGIRIVFEADGGDSADGTAIHGIHFHPKDVGGAILSIDQTEVAAEWAWAGPKWRDHVQTEVVQALESVTIEVPDPAATAATWGALLDSPVDAAHRLRLDDAVLCFVEGGDRGVVGLGVRPSDRWGGVAVDLLGTEISAGD